jgi:parvulin-like peptidyl-prolyl isomerase
LIGPVELSVPHPTLAQILTLSQPGQISPPTRVGEWLVLVRLERFIPAQMDESMRRRLLTECFNSWLQNQLGQLELPVQETVQEAVQQPTSSGMEPSSATSPELINAVTPTAS